MQNFEHDRQYLIGYTNTYQNKTQGILQRKVIEILELPQTWKESS